jgi:hypothetical protein
MCVPPGRDVRAAGPRCACRCLDLRNFSLAVNAKERSRQFERKERPVL